VTSYLRIYLIGAGTLFLSVTFVRFLQAHGLMRECMLVQVTGVVVNLALDPLLIFVLDLGLVGAGLGTVLGQVASGALALGFYLRGVGMSIEVRPNAASCCDTCAVALPVILTELSESIMMFVLGGVAGLTDPLFALIMGTAGVSWACLAFVAGDVCAALYARSAWGRAI